jgi:hypothetical protein
VVVRRRPVQTTKSRLPWHFWVVGPFYVLLYGAGAYDYAMTHRRDAAYFTSQDYDDAQIAYFSDYPLVPDVFWTVAVWGALCAAALLLFRSRWAIPVVLVALTSQVCLDVITFAFMDRWQILGPRLAVFDGGVLLLTVGLLFYCRAMAARDLLR